MANDVFSPTSNHEKGAPVGGVSSAEDGQQLVLRLDPTTKRLLVAATIGGIADGDVVDVANGGMLILGTDGTNYQVLSVDSSGKLNVNVASAVVTATDLDIRNLVFATDKVDVTGSTGVGVTGTFWQATQPVSLAAGVDVTDKATRLLGVIYGSQGAQLQQKVTSNDLIVTLDGESVAVTGTFWQATQPVSGTFWQATQPVSIAATVTTDVSDRAGRLLGVIYGSQGVQLQQKVTSNDLVVTLDGESVAVTGTFYQATQPISIASGGVASGAIASGAIASGAIASGAVASGAVVDGAIVTLGAKTDAKSTATDATSITAMQVLKQISASVQAPPSQAVTNAGTFVVQENGAALTSLQLIDNAISGAGFNITQLGGAAVPIGAGLEATAVRVTLPTNGTGIVGLATGSNAIGKLAANSGIDIGDVDITSIVPLTGATNLGKAEDGAHTSGDVGVFALAVRDDTIGATSGTEGDYEALHTNENGALWVEQSPSTKGGLSVGNFTSGDTYTALTATAQVLKASAGKFFGYYIYNPNTAATYVEIYNIAAASVTVGTSTATLVFCIPASSAANLALPIGIPFGTAMSIAATTTGGGNTAPTTALEAMIWYA